MPLNLSELLGIVGAASLIFTFAKEFGTQVSTATAISVIAALVVAFTVAISRLWQREGDRFRLILTSDGNENIRFIQAARESVLVTHFTAMLPSRTYTALMRDKLDEGVHIIRIVDTETASNSDTIRWLEQFRDHERYSEYMLPQTILPFDFTVYDDEVVVLYFPSSSEGKDYNQAMEFRNPKLAMIFTEVFERIKRHSEQTSETKMGNAITG